MNYLKASTVSLSINLIAAVPKDHDLFQGSRALFYKFFFQIGNSEEENLSFRVYIFEEMKIVFNFDNFI